MTKGAKKSVRRCISALVSSRSSITIIGDNMLSLQCTSHQKHIHDNRIITAVETIWRTDRNG